MGRTHFDADDCGAYADPGGVKRLCELVEITRFSYTWLTVAPLSGKGSATDAALAKRICRIHVGDNTLDAPKVTAELNDSAINAERTKHQRVARTMRWAAIASYVKRRRLRTTIPAQVQSKLTVRLRRDFTAPVPNRRYVGDITGLPLAEESNSYLATDMDYYSR